MGRELTTGETVMSFWSLLDRTEPIVDEGDAVPVCPDPALVIIDEALSTFACRALVSGNEIVDRLLDLRNALVAATLLRDLEAIPSR